MGAGQLFSFLALQSAARLRQLLSLARHLSLYLTPCKTLDTSGMTTLNALPPAMWELFEPFLAWYDFCKLLVTGDKKLRAVLLSGNAITSLFVDCAPGNGLICMPDWVSLFPRLKRLSIGDSSFSYSVSKMSTCPVTLFPRTLEHLELKFWQALKWAVSASAVCVPVATDKSSDEVPLYNLPNLKTLVLDGSPNIVSEGWNLAATAPALEVFKTNSLLIPFRLSRLPPGLTVLSCPHNSLMRLSDILHLPTSITELEIMQFDEWRWKEREWTIEARDEALRAAHVPTFLNHLPQLVTLSIMLPQPWQLWTQILNRGLTKLNFLAAVTYGGTEDLFDPHFPPSLTHLDTGAERVFLHQLPRSLTHLPKVAVDTASASQTQEKQNNLPKNATNLRLAQPLVPRDSASLGIALTAPLKSLRLHFALSNPVAIIQDLPETLESLHLLLNCNRSTIARLPAFPPRLTVLRLFFEQINPPLLSPLPPRLTELDLSGAILARFDAKDLPPLPASLSALTLSTSNTIEPTLLPLLPHNLKTLVLNHVLDGASLQNMAALPRSLTELSMPSCRDLSDSAILGLPPNLVTLSVPNTPADCLTKACLKDLPASLKSLQTYTKLRVAWSAHRRDTAIAKWIHDVK